MKYLSYSAAGCLVIAILWLGWRQHQLAGEMALLRAKPPAGMGGTGRPDASSAAVDELRNRFERTRIDLSAALHGISQTSTKVDSLQKMVESLNRQMQVTLAMRETSPSVIPALAKTVPTSERATPPPRAAPVFKPKAAKAVVRRPWGAEQATGAPDTMHAGDVSSAWAPLSPNSGIQWLQLEYEKPVEPSEIRVRETFNPGAVCKITALDASGQEIKLWEGVEPPTQAPMEMSFPAACRVQTDTVKIYLDTRRVSGWNEIDAVELVGRDGSRQWALNASASSSYADR